MRQLEKRKLKVKVKMLVIVAIIIIIAGCAFLGVLSYHGGKGKEDLQIGKSIVIESVDSLGSKVDSIKVDGKLNLFP